MEIRDGKTVADMKDIVAVRCTHAVPPPQMVLCGEYDFKFRIVSLFLNESHGAAHTVDWYYLH